MPDDTPSMDDPGDDPPMDDPPVDDPPVADPLAVDGAKRTFVELSQGALDEDAARARIRASWTSEDMKEGLAAVQAGRKANFKGR